MPKTPIPEIVVALATARWFPTLAKIGYARQNLMEERAAKRAQASKAETITADGSKDS